MTWRLYALLSGGAFVATYLVSGQPGTLAPARTSPPRPAAASSPPSTAEHEIQELANRLEDRVRQAVSYQSPTRNPFEFGHVRQAPSQRVVAPKLPEVPVVVAPPPPPPPPFTLSGVATNRVDGAVQRTAIFSGSNGVILAREGEIVGGFKVMAIEEEAAVLESTLDASTHRLALSRR
jgi:hypothetical protein